MNYKSFNLGDWIDPINGVIGDETTLDGNEMRDLVEFLSGLSRWIPVSERLPEEETDVLVCNINGDIDISSGSYSTEINEFIWYTSGWRFGKVIAWMPLPQPYKAESEE